MTLLRIGDTLIDCEQIRLVIKESDTSVLVGFRDGQSIPINCESAEEVLEWLKTTPRREVES